MLLSFTVLAFFVIFQWTMLFVQFTASDDGSGNEVASIQISPISSHRHGRLYVVKYVQDSLNLTCTVFDNSTSEPDYNISWIFPYRLYNRNKPDLNKFIAPSRISLSFFIPSLESKDEGDYSCNAQLEGSNQEPLSTYVSVNVKNPPYYKGMCSDTQFGCSFSNPPSCIHQRYKCDGHEDCQMGEDEALPTCGAAPCDDKLPCKDPYMLVERCIPKSWCCDKTLDDNCTTKQPLSCCPHRSADDRNKQVLFNTKHDTDMAFLETTIYTVIGCAMVFMIAVTVLAIAICRVHMKRSFLSRCPVEVVHHRHAPSQPGVQGQTGHPQACEMDLCLGRACAIDSLLVTYNINRGVQLTGHTINPPPYSKVMAAPPHEGPPPPYSSQERLHIPEGQGLLQLRAKDIDEARPSIVQSMERVEGGERETFDIVSRLTD